MEGYHSSVLLTEVLQFLNVKEGNWYLDATLGDGGHSLEILKRGGKVIALDVDEIALERAKKRFTEARIDQNQFMLIKGNFRDLENLIKQQTEIEFKGIVFDLGVSSLQLESPERGFSFLKEGVLDMRMDQTLQVRALDLINGLNKGELYELFTKFGEEKLARRFAEAVARAREIKPIGTTTELADIIARATGRWKGKIHPATRVFQALRIAINDELGAITEALPQALKKIEKNGLLLVISFQSLEDRIVKLAFKQWSDQGVGEILTKKPIIPGLEEISTNPRSRSAKMRVFRKL